MALVQFGAFITEIRGKIGDVLYSRNRGGSYVRNIGTLTDAASASQLEMRNFLALGVQFWQKMTTDCQLSWTMYAQTHGYKINYYHSGVVAGYNAFLSAFISKCVSDGFPFNNIVLNPDFATDTIWIKGGSWAISGGTANVNSVANEYLYQNNSLVLYNTSYYLQFEVSNFVSGAIHNFFNGYSVWGAVSGSSNGTFYGFVTTQSAGNPRVYFRANPSTQLSVDNSRIMNVNQYPSDLL